MRFHVILKWFFQEFPFLKKIRKYIRRKKINNKNGQRNEEIIKINQN